MRIAVVTGGHIEYDYVRKELETREFDAIIACDSGCRFFLDEKINFDYAVGDFDSIDKKHYELLMGEYADKVTKYPSEKDYTDTEIAVNLAMDLIDKDKSTTLENSEIILYGATGTRIDHILGNIELLYKPTVSGVRIAITDSHNRIELIKDRRVIAREAGYPFFSIVPYGVSEVTVSEHGCKYELSNHKLGKGVTLGISNEVTADAAEIKVTCGMLVLVMSRD
ncbi:MAG: thiamine diphosphokinase [Lachnospiraceae bacterium]|nr:thiamine diphosphokinase [Lachnospiraceae bacterium]MBO4461764.1 thiamine diphosphokinase [Lachnospiraceae bacterium]